MEEPLSIQILPSVFIMLSLQQSLLFDLFVDKYRTFRSTGLLYFQLFLLSCWLQKIQGKKIQEFWRQDLF